MSNPSNNSHPGRRVTLPSIRDLFRDEFMQSPPGESPSSTLARLGVEDDGNRTSHTSSSQSTTSFVPSRTIYGTAGPESTSFPSSTSNRARVLSDASRYPSTYPTQPSSNPPFYPPHAFPQPDASLDQRPPNLPTYQSQSYPTSQSTPQPPHSLGNVPSFQGPYPSQSHPNLRGLMSRELSQVSHVSASPGPSSSAPQHNLDSPPALTRAAAPWVIATNLDVGQVYEDDERTPIARPFDGNSLTRSTSRAISLGRFFDDASGTPLGKYECQFCGKLFNRPSSLRIHLNSHTGEKPYVCSYPDCGRSFSVLSNMRRHARVHASNTKEQESEELIDESSVPLSPATSSSANPSVQAAAPMQSNADSRHHYRQDSNTSTSSSRSRGRSSGIKRVGEEEEERETGPSRHGQK